MKSKRRKLLAIAVAISIISSSTAINNLTPACMPEDPLASLEKQADKDHSKRKNKKGYLV